MKLLSNLAFSQAMQAALARFMQDRDYKRHLTYKTGTLLVQRDQLVQALNKDWKNELKVTIPNGGLTVYLELDSTINTGDLYNAAATQKIIIAPGALFSLAPNFTHFMRLNFNHPTLGNREKAIAKLSSIGSKHLIR
ncbi:aminotransferase class I/II-fold pyridoxal phosphate-dependent enzyme [Glaciecola sp. 33A]|jgi:DNA-binding transcriptional MocR family regulator|uniref:aminotransferase class I/II-fold pyridoxal phosphate-dependent enzyme n=1 Tax=Glaciecola sp. 33A TaxID=2057807 RepID=UPI0018E2EB7E|nr:aminotransferase class I/II-fold pyridoxal phosphate-dependent enzyme [Glaciecola sp. 33A]